MQFLSNAIVTTLVILVLLLPAFIVLRIFWGSSRGDIHADNIYTYLVWGLPLSLFIYGVYYELKVYKVLDPSMPFPTSTVWNLFANDENKIDSAGSSIKKIVPYTVIKTTDSIFETSIISRKEYKPAFDTVRMVSNNTYRDSASGQLTTTSSYIISKNNNGNVTKNGSKSRRFIRTIVHTDTVRKVPSEYQLESTPSQSLFSVKKYLIKHFFIVLVLCLLLSWLLREFLLLVGADRIKIFRFESELHYILSGRLKKFEDIGTWKFGRLYRTEYKVQADLLCQIGNTMKIYRGIIKKFKVRDDCIEYIVLKNSQRGDLLSEKTSDNQDKLPKNDFDISLNQKRGKTSLTIKPTDLKEFIRVLRMPAKFSDSINDLHFINITGNIMYFKREEIKNVNIQYIEDQEK